MPIIPRYQARGGPRLQTLDYAGAYQPPGGEDWRALAQAARAGGAIIDGVETFKGPPKPPATPQRGGQNSSGSRPAKSSLMEGKASDIAWRRRLVQAGNGVGAQGVMLSRQEARDGLGPEAAAYFDGLTLAREAGFVADAVAREAAALREQELTLSEERQAVGVDEFHLLFDSAPEQAKAALGSAVRELGDRLLQSGLDEAEVAVAQRALVSTAHAERIGQAVSDDVGRARQLLEGTNALLEADRRRLTQDIEAEESRLQARHDVAEQAASLEDLADNPEPLFQWAQEAAGDDPGRAELYAGAAMGEVVAARTAKAAREDQAWKAVTPFLERGGLRSWTDLPAPIWAGLSQSQKLRVLDAIGMPEPAPSALAPTEGDRGGLQQVAWQRPGSQPAPAQGSGPFWGTPPQAKVSREERNLLILLAARPQKGEHLVVDPETGRLSRWVASDTIFRNGPGKFVPVSDLEVQRFKERQLGVADGVFGRVSPEEARMLKQLRKGEELKTTAAHPAKRELAAALWRFDPRVQAFLTMVSEAEVAEYDSKSGDLKDAPNKFHDYGRHPGKGRWTTSSGRYQLVQKTYRAFASQLGLTDFSPETQDLVATQILLDRGVLERLRAGDFAGAMSIASNDWASLSQGPGKPNRYPDQKHYQKYEDSEARYRALLAEAQIRPPERDWPKARGEPPKPVPMPPMQDSMFDPWIP